jgi:hypothetical protein
MTNDTPKGKRTVKHNIYGNLVGYVGGKRWEEFGDAYCRMNRAEAAAWAAGATRAEARLAMPEDI